MASTKKYCLLVVDDEAEVCDSVYNLFRRDYQVLRAHDSEEALRLMGEFDVHIILTDQRMPRISGVELLKEVRGEHPEAIRVLFTGYAGLDDVIAAINQGHVYHFLQKPWQPEEIQAAVANAVSEYERLVEQKRFLQLARQRVAELENRVHSLEGRVEQLEKENRNLRDDNPS